MGGCENGLVLVEGKESHILYYFISVACVCGGVSLCRFSVAIKRLLRWQCSLIGWLHDIFFKNVSYEGSQAG
jgi:hypothetical protein